MIPHRWLCVLYLELGCVCVTMTIKFEFGNGYDGESFSFWDTNTVTANLATDFLFFGSKRSTVLISDNGAISFTAPPDTLNNMEFTAANQWIAPLGYDAYTGAGIWVNSHLKSSTDGQLATQIVRDFLGTDTYEGETLSVITWDSIKDGTREVNTFQVALSQNSVPDESYVIFMYDTIQTTSTAVKVGLSYGDGTTIATAWDGSNTALGCDSSSLPAVQDLTSRAQTACNTRAGVLVFAVKDVTSFNKGNMCLHLPNSDCPAATTQAPVRPVRCRQRRKRSDTKDL